MAGVGPSTAASAPSRASIGSTRSVAYVAVSATTWATIGLDRSGGLPLRDSSEDSRAMSVITPKKRRLLPCITTC